MPHMDDRVPSFHGCCGFETDQRFFRMSKPVDVNGFDLANDLVARQKTAARRGHDALGHLLLLGSEFRIEWRT